MLMKYFPKTLGTNKWRTFIGTRDLREDATAAAAVFVLVALDKGPAEGLCRMAIQLFANRASTNDESFSTYESSPRLKSDFSAN